MNNLPQELNKVLNDGDYEIIDCITNKSKEKEYIKQTKHLIEKYKHLTKRNKTQIIKGKKFLLKPAVT